MKTKKNIIIEQYTALSLFLQKLTEADMLDLENGSKKIIFEISHKKKRIAKILSIDESSMLDIISELDKMTSREEGLDLLNNKCSLRMDYESIAKRRDIPHSKKDKIDKLKEKIIEGTIGFRLRSQAIHNKSE